MITLAKLRTAFANECRFARDKRGVTVERENGYRVGTAKTLAEASKMADAFLAGMDYATPRDLFVCGDDRIREASISPESAAKEPTCHWKSSVLMFATTTDCKTSPDGKLLGISSSSGALAVVDKASRQSIFTALLSGAHSVEFLPGNRLAAAAAWTQDKDANQVAVYDIATGRKLHSVPFVAAHGLAFVNGNLWALGGTALRCFAVDDSGQLHLARELRIPGTDGHDLTTLPADETRLFLSTALGCYYFDTSSMEFEPHEFLASTPGVSSYSVHPVSGRIAHVRRNGQDWWSDTVRLDNPEGDLVIPGARLYKARWS